MMSCMAWRTAYSRWNLPHVVCNYSSQFQLGGPQTPPWNNVNIHHPWHVVSLNIQTRSLPTTLIQTYDITQQWVLNLDLCRQLLVWVVHSTSHLRPIYHRFFFHISGSAESVREHLEVPPAYIPVCDIACVTMKHQSISKWLSQLGLPQYCVVLEQEYDGVEVKSKET